MREPEEPRSSNRRGYLTSAVALGTAWLIPVALATTQTKLRAAADGGEAVSWINAFLFQLPLWSPLLLVAPLAFVLARRFPIESAPVSATEEGSFLWGRRLLAVIGLGLALAVVYLFLSAAVSVVVEGRQLSPNSLLGASAALAVRTFHLDLFIVGAVIAAGYARENYLRVQSETLRAVRLREQLSQARLSALKAQLRPHFLFNVLHSISSLLDEDRNKARDMIVALSDLLRHTLGAMDGQETTLGEELVSADLYLAIEEIRFEDRLSVVREIETDTLDALVPSLLLQPLVENAVLHGIETHDGPGRIFLRANRVGRSLVIAIENTASSEPAKHSSSAGGLGLANTRARLERLYGDRASVELRPVAGGVETVVRLPYRTASVAG